MRPFAVTTSSACVGQVVDRARHPLGEREVEVDHRIRRSLAARGRGGEHVGAHARGRLHRLGGADPRGRAREPIGLAGQVGTAGEHGFDRRGLVGIARVERVRAEQRLRLGVRELVGVRSPLTSFGFEGVGDAPQRQTQA